MFAIVICLVLLMCTLTNDLKSITDFSVGAHCVNRGCVALTLIWKFRVILNCHLQSHASWIRYLPGF